jgi:hypothetical protein
MEKSHAQISRTNLTDKYHGKISWTNLTDKSHEKTSGTNLTDKPNRQISRTNLNVSVYAAGAGVAPERVRGHHTLASLPTNPLLEN